MHPATALEVRYPELVTVIRVLPRVDCLQRCRSRSVPVVGRLRAGCLVKAQLQLRSWLVMKRVGPRQPVQHSGWVNVAAATAVSGARGPVTGPRRHRQTNNGERDQSPCTGGVGGIHGTRKLAAIRQDRLGRPPTAHRPAAARAPRTTAWSTCGHASAPPAGHWPRAKAGGGPCRGRRISASGRPTAGRRARMTRAHDRQKTLPQRRRRSCMNTPRASCSHRGGLLRAVFRTIPPHSNRSHHHCTTEIAEEDAVLETAKGRHTGAPAEKAKATTGG